MKYALLINIRCKPFPRAVACLDGHWPAAQVLEGMVAEIKRHMARDAAIPSVNKCITAAALQALAQLAITHPDSTALAVCAHLPHLCLPCIFACQHGN